MASTKYRKKEKSDVPVEAKKPNDTVSDSPAPSSPAGRKKTQELKEEIPAPLLVKEDTCFAQEENEDQVSDEQIIDCIAVEDQKNIFEIKLLKKINRLTRVAFYLNGIEIRPHTYAGSNAGSSYFRLLKMTQKK